jgi:hypothetical protein
MENTRATFALPASLVASESVLAEHSPAELRVTETCVTWNGSLFTSVAEAPEDGY